MPLKGAILNILWTLVLCLLPTLALAQSDFDLEAFNELATRAEQVVDDGLASSEALEDLRSRLADARSAALDTQNEHSNRSKTLRDQIDALGPKPADGEVETEEVAARRLELNDQLAVANEPAVVAQEAYQRADGLISEIDATIRGRQAETAFKFGTSPVNPVHWGPALQAMGSYFVQIKTEVATALNNPNRKALRLQNMPRVLIIGILGLLLMFPVSNWVSGKMTITTQKGKTTRRNLSRLALSILVLIVPLVGFILVGRAISLLDIFGLRGDLFMQSFTAIGISIYGANWLGRNLFVENGPASELIGLKQRRLVGAYKLTLLMGIVLALWWGLKGLNAGAELSIASLTVWQFPLVALGGYALIMFGKKIYAYRKRLLAKDEPNPIADRVSRILFYLCFATGISGPIAALLGYANLGSILVISTILSLAIIAGFFILYTLIALFTDARSEPEDTQAPKGGLFRVFLAFALACFALPILALIWGARVSDIQDVWLALRDGISFGDTRISLSDFITFGLIFSICYTVTRLLQSTLRTAVLPNTNIDSGAQNALVTGLGYVGIFLAALLAIMSTGLDLSSLAIVAGALSVGIGFGLQNIVSNFVSGVILLIERPIRLGDWVEVGTYSGYVSDISVRATTIETFDESEVIIPNADFISGAVKNLTHNNKRGRLKVPVGVAYDSDAERVKEILLDITSQHAMVLKKPAPYVFLLGFGADSIDFEIRAILRDVNYIGSTRSDINFEILKRFRAEGIEIPFGQRDIHIKNANEFVKLLGPSKAKKS